MSDLWIEEVAIAHTLGIEISPADHIDSVFIVFQGSHLSGPYLLFVSEMIDAQLITPTLFSMVTLYLSGAYLLLQRGPADHSDYILAVVLIDVYLTAPISGEDAVDFI